MKSLLILVALLFAQPEVKIPRIRSIKYENFKGVSVDQATHRLKDRGVRIALEQPYETEQLAAARKVLQELLEEKGRTGLEVQSTVREIPPSSIELTFKAVKN